MPKIVDDEVLDDHRVYLFNIVVILEVLIALYRCYNQPNAQVNAEYSVQWPPYNTEHRDPRHYPIDSYRPIQLVLREIIRKQCILAPEEWMYITVKCCRSQAVYIILASVDSSVWIVKRPLDPESVLSDGFCIRQDELQLYFYVLLVFFDLLRCHLVSRVVSRSHEASLVEKHGLDVVIVAESAAERIVKLIDIQASLYQ